jgi:hypothetical protein
MTSDSSQHRQGAWNGRRGRFFRIPYKNICAPLPAVDFESGVTSRRFSTCAVKGQTFVEFALIFPLLLAIILGISEFGRLLVTYTSVAAAGREAARYDASVGGKHSGIAHYRDCLGIRETVAHLNLLLDANKVIMYDVHGPGGASPVQKCQSGASFDPQFLRRLHRFPNENLFLQFRCPDEMEFQVIDSIRAWVETKPQFCQPSGLPAFIPTACSRVFSGFQLLRATRSNLVPLTRDGYDRG